MKTVLVLLLLLMLVLADVFATVLLLFEVESFALIDADTLRAAIAAAAI